MRTGGSKSKGNQWENKVYDDIRKLGFMIRKNKGSGNAADNKGDLETNNLLIECKHHKTISEKEISEWMNKIVNEAIPLGKFPLLITKENYKDARVYYINPNNDITFMSYDTWKQQVLPLEQGKVVFMPAKDKDVPTYIG